MGSNKNGISDAQFKSPLIFTTLHFHSSILNVGLMVSFSHLIPQLRHGRSLESSVNETVMLQIITSIGVLMWV